MALLRAGAYSQKFQSLEKERMRQQKEQEKTNRGKAQFYSKQTALRQKALEEKKKAMEIAEEDRRKKALEERREAQQEATKRFRSALCRIRSSSKGQQAQSTKKSNQNIFEFYLPDKPRPKGTSTSTKKSNPNEETRERIAFGKDVEIKLKPMNGYHPPRKINGLQRRTPSLDDVLGQIKGERNIPQHSQEPSVINHGRIHVHKRVPDMFQQAPTMGKRSSSDPSLNCKRASSSSDSHPHAVKNHSDGSLSFQATHNLQRNLSDENIVFKTVQDNQYTSKMDDDLRVTSPDTPISFNELLMQPFTPDLRDSLDTVKSCSIFTVGEEEDPQTQEESATHSESTQDAGQSVLMRGVSPLISIPLGTGQQQPVVNGCDSDDLSSVDSLEDRTTPLKQTSGLATHSYLTYAKGSRSAPVSRIAEQLREAELLKEAKEKPKVVGILKKSSSSMSMSNRNTETEYAKSKKVRFADRIETSDMDVSNQIASSNDNVDSSHIELWKKVLPNGVTTHYLPNSAFTPKMKVSLNSKPPPSQPILLQPQAPKNGLTVHIPVPSTDSSPPSPQRQPNKETTSAQSKMSTASVGLNGVMPTSPNDQDPSSQLMREAQRNVSTALKHISLEKTPTDDEITKLWDQIRDALEDNQKVLIPPQVFNFRIDPGGQSKHSSETASVGSSTRQSPTIHHRDDQRAHHSARRTVSADRFYSKPSDVSSQKGATQRQANLSRPTRSQTNFSSQSAQLLARRGHSYTATYPITSRQDQHTVQMSSAEPDLLRTNGRKAPTALSMEEKRLMLSIENLNQKIKDHMARHPSVTKFQTPVSPEPPEFTPEFYPHPPPSPTPPQMHRVTPTLPHSHMYNLPKTRNIRRNPKTGALAAAISHQAGDHSRTHHRAPGHRPMFYNT